MATLTKLTNPHDLYAERQMEVQAKIEQLRIKVETHAMREAADPKNWGYNGDLGHVNQVLDELLEFFRG